ncbi:MAG: serine/threonine protein kinase, partial [Dokdonella sp.]
MPFMMVLLMVLFGADLYADAPSVIYSGSAVGILGLIATWWFHRWSRDPRRPRLARFVDDSMTGDSLREAQAHLDEIARFERE